MVAHSEGPHLLASHRNIFQLFAFYPDLNFSVETAAQTLRELHYVTA